jgi:hypothetical protein
MRPLGKTVRALDAVVVREVAGRIPSLTLTNALQRAFSSGATGLPEALE